ncbi:hypothetical protein [Paenibacillus roseipurpureus]|uniref:Uncharacterized protein n=1 Tax=Paenibacillus roseopurpureus TaxID=2918901 RepID=A0AA96LMV4_9BACL|nr:hypothetical protein [Paenibacillus sp. MBLB1832]WNR43919.1 hypothetical protein MJB10_22930 [Paenibacillus sp. MBLB1832]
MNPIFMILFLLIVAGTCLIDRSMLRMARAGNKFIYGLTVCLILVIFFCEYFQVHIPMPTYFFIRVVTPWFARVLGI